MIRWRLMVGLVLLGALAGCSKRAKPVPTGGSDVPPSKVNLKRQVELARVEQKPLVSNVDAVGVLEPEAITEIAAGVAGIVDEVLFREGDRVDPADKRPLVRIDQKRYLAGEKVAEAALLESDANLAGARDAFQRAQDSGKGISAAERKQVMEALHASEARQLSAQAQLELARLNHARSMVMPPYPGQINRRMVNAGEYLDEKRVIATVANLNSIRLVGYIPESAAPLVRRRVRERPQQVALRQILVGLANARSGGLAGYLTAADAVPSGYDPEFYVQPLPQLRFFARIFYLSTVADPNTHMFECKAEVDPRTPGWVELAPGYTAKIRYPVETSAAAIIIPEESARATERGFVVFEPLWRTGRDGAGEWVAHAVRIEVGTRTPGSIEVRAGLRPGQSIVRRGAEALEEGTPLQFREGNAPPQPRE